MNPGFEDALDNWNTTGNAAIRTNDPPAYEGSNYIFGEDAPRFSIWQDVHLDEHDFPHSAIDSGLLNVVFGGWQSSWREQTDNGQISVQFLDENSTELGDDELPTFFSNHTWVEQSTVSDIPTGTRTIRYFFEGNRNQGSNNDAFLDAAHLGIATLGDFDGNGELNAEDINLLTTAVLFETNAPLMDVNEDGRVDQTDRTVWVRDLKNTWFGDSNLDGEFNSGDLVMVFQRGEFEDEIANNSSWADGDWNGDGEFNSSDFVNAFQDGGFEKGARVATIVPEPCSVGLLWIGFISVIANRCRVRHLAGL